MKKVKLFEEYINESKFKVGDTWEWKTQDGTKIVSITNIKPNGDIIAREDGSSEDFIVRDANKYLKKKVNESETIYHQYDFLGMQAQAANMTREEWIAHYGTPEIGSGIDESKKGIYTVYFEDRDGEIQDWDVPASSPEEAIKLVQDGKALGPYDQTLPRGARNFSAKFYK
jgi:hypothetical protein